MKELNEYREKLVARLGEAALEVKEAYTKVKDPFAIIEGDWTLHQIAVHLRDIDKNVYGMRILRTLKEENPVFESFDPDAWMAAHYDKAEPFAGIVDEFVAGVEKICAELQAMPVAGWSREGSHQTLGGGLTLQLWVERSLAHIEEHLAAFKHGVK